jgi:hydroxymethylglutaryl-CoA lyase
LKRKRDLNVPASVRIVEVGPRDGLQNEPSPVPTAAKVRLIESLTEAGLRTIESGSFVSPLAVPSMADSAAVFQTLNRHPGVSYTALVANVRGLEAALASGVTEIAVFASASESFSQANLKASVADSLLRYRDVAGQAIKAGVRVRGYVSCVWGCPYEGPVPPSSVIRVSQELFSLGCYEVSLGDTIGVGTAGPVGSLLSEVLAGIPASKLAVHFHDTFGQGLANILVALQMSIGVVDSSVAGLGGCPYAPGATGNVATEDLLYMLHGLNVQTGINLEKVAAAGWEICSVLGKPPASKTSRALAARQRR